MDAWERSVSVLPVEMRENLLAVPYEWRDEIQEIRFRCGHKILLTGRNGCRNWGDKECKSKDLYDVFSCLCNYSVYAHQEEIRHGYVAASNGCRAGIAGRAVIENGQVVSVRDITSICLRLAREHHGCASSLVATIHRPERLKSVLVCGGPSSGKTSILRELVRVLSSDVRRPRQLAVVDERGELILPMTGKCCCDVLSGFPKTTGIEQALRTLSPEGIVFDELGGDADVRAVKHCLHSGVASIASVHADGLESLRQRAPIKEVLQSGGFDFVALMRGRGSPGEIAQILPVTEVWL